MFHARARPAHRKVWKTTSWRFCGRRTATSTTQTASSTSSNSEIVPRSGNSRHRLVGRLAPTRVVPIPASVVDADGRLALAAEEPRRPEDHDQQKQDEEEHLSDGRRDVIAADRLDDADADAAEQC